MNFIPHVAFTMYVDSTGRDMISEKTIIRKHPPILLSIRRLIRPYLKFFRSLGMGPKISVPRIVTKTVPKIVSRLKLGPRFLGMNLKLVWDTFCSSISSSTSALRYPTEDLLRELFERVWDYWQKTHQGREDCAKFFLERGLSLTSGVEGEFATDGVQTCQMFLLGASSPVDVAELILHHKVSQRQPCTAMSKQQEAVCGAVVWVE